MSTTTAAPRSATTSRDDIEVIEGSSNDDTLIGCDATRRCATIAGEDTLDGRGGADCEGGDDFDQLTGGSSPDFLLGAGHITS